MRLGIISRVKVLLISRRPHAAKIIPGLAVWILGCDSLHDNRFLSREGVMTGTHMNRVGRAAIAVLLFTATSLAHSTTIGVTIDSSLLNGLPAVLAFDFIDGSPPDNTVILSALTSDGTPGPASTTGNVTGTG